MPRNNKETKRLLEQSISQEWEFNALQSEYYFFNIEQSWKQIIAVIKCCNNKAKKPIWIDIPSVWSSIAMKVKKQPQTGLIPFIWNVISETLGASISKVCPTHSLIGSFTFLCIMQTMQILEHAKRTEQHKFCFKNISSQISTLRSAISQTGQESTNSTTNTCIIQTVSNLKSSSDTAILSYKKYKIKKLWFGPFSFSF